MADVAGKYLEATSSKYLDVGGMRLHYKEQGSDSKGHIKDKMTLVYLHSYGTNMTSLGYQIYHFGRQGKGWVAWDGRGDGRSTHSTKKEDYSLGNFTSDLEQIVAAEGIKKLVIVGHSAGGMAAQDFTAENPDKVRALVLIATSYNFRETFVKDAENSAKARMLLLISPLLPVLETSCNMLGGLFQKDRSGYYPDYSELKFRAMSDRRWDFEMAWNKSHQQLRATHVLGQAVMEWDTSSIAGKIHVPTLLVYGGSDWLVPPKTAYDLQEKIPGAKYFKPIIIPNARHGLTFQAPEEVNAAMDDFLAALK